MSNVPLPRRKDAAWMDQVAVERYLAEQPVGRPLTFAERGEVARRLHQRWVTTTARALRVRPGDVQAALYADPDQLAAA